MSTDVTTFLATMSVRRTPSNRAGPCAQKINAWLHREPQVSISYCVYWTIFFVFWTPIAIVFLQIQMIVKLVSWYRGKDYYDPKQHPEKELAVVVMGCDSGFGKEICLWAADAGFVVFAACLKTESVEEFGHYHLNNNIHAMVMDVMSDKDVANIVSHVKKWLDGVSTSKKQRVLHGLVNNAGIWTGAAMDWTDLSVYQKVMDVNFFGMVRCCKAFIPIFQDQAIHNSYYTGARIINMSSIMGFLALANTTAYASSKHAVVAFTAGLRMELKGFGIQVSTVNPSFHSTGLAEQLGDALTGFWKNLSTESRDKYGEAFFQQKLELSKNLSTKLCCWKMSVVVEEVVRSLTLKNVCAEMTIGSDARFFWMPLVMLPAGLREFVWNKTFPSPTPVAMQRST